MARGGRASGGIKRTGSYGAGSTKDPRLAPGGDRMTREQMKDNNRAARERLEAGLKKTDPKPGMNARIEALPTVRGEATPQGKAGRMAEVYRNTSNRLGATGDTRQAQRYAERAELLGKISAGKPAPAPATKPAAPAPAAAKPKAAKAAAAPSGSMDKMGFADLKALAAQHGVAHAKSKQQTIARIKAAQASGVTPKPTAPVAPQVKAPAPKAPASATLDIGARVQATAVQAQAAMPPAPKPAVQAPTNDSHMGTVSTPQPSELTMRIAEHGKKLDALNAQLAKLSGEPKTFGQKYGKAIGIGAAAGIAGAMLYAANKAKAEGLGAADQAKAAGTEGAKVGTGAAVTIAGSTAAIAGLAKLGMGVTPAGLAVTGAFMAKGAWDHRAEGLTGMAKGAYEMSPVGAAVGGVQALGHAVQQRFAQAQADFHAAKPETSGVKGTRNINNLKAIIANKQAKALARSE